MNPKVSVIIPVYNGADYLARAIRSALDQSYPPYEVIVIDDGSIDGTPEILESFKDRITARRIPNSGAGAARNTGLQMATGDLIAFLDHDDVWFRNKLEKQVRALEEHPSAGFVCCDFTVRYPHLGNRMLRHFSILKHPDLINYDGVLRNNPFRVLIEEHFVGTSSSVLIRKEIVRKVGLFNPAYKSTQDYDYWLRCAVMTDFIVLPDVLFYKKNHPFNISRNVLRTHYFRKEVLREAITKNASYIRRNHLETVCRQALSDCYFFLGNLQFEAAHILEAYRSYLRGLWTQPSAGNLGKFSWSVLKKTGRLLTFNLISRKTFGKKNV